MNWFYALIFLGFGFSWAVRLEIKDQEKAEPKTELIWPKECNGGPEYWCQNLRSAKECNAVDHCSQTVWSHHTMKLEDEKPACKRCLSVMEAIKDSPNNITVKQIEIVLDTACHLVPSYLIAKECVFVINEFVPFVQKEINDINPMKLCNIMYLCSAETSKKYFESKNISIPSDAATLKITATDNGSLPPKTEVSTKSKTNADIDCKGCYTLASTAKKMFKKTSRDDLLNGMLELCGKMSSFSDACSTYVITYFSNIYERLDQATVGEVCHMSGTCDEIYHFHKETPDYTLAIVNAPDKPNDEVCDFCVAMVKHVRDIIVANTTEDQFQKVLDGMCKQTGNFKDECLQLVDQYYNLIYQFLITELNGTELCKDIKLCVPKAAMGELTGEVPLWPVVPSSLNLDELLKNETSVQTELHRVPLTEAVVKPKHLLGAKKCTWGPAYWCTNMTTSKECSGSLDHCIKNVWEKLELPVDNGDICNICKDMVKEARDQLNSNETQEELRQVFEGSCKIIPIKIAKKECIKAVDDFIPELVEALSSQMNPQVVCATVGLCNSPRMDMLLQQEKLAKSKESAAVLMQPLPIDRMFPSFLEDPEIKNEVEKRGKEACELCELFLHYVQQEITLPASEEQIKKVVDNVCTELPKDVANKCTSFIQEYGDAFISILAQEIDPSTVCPSIGACPAFLGFIDKVKPTCPLCLMAVTSIENKLKNNKTEENVIAALDTLCIELPHKMAKECQLFVNNSYSELIDSVMADFSPQETCLYLKLCSAPNEMAEMIPTQKASPEDTNEVHSVDVTSKNDTTCVLCEFVMNKLDQELKDKTTADEIKHAVHNICNHMPSSIRKQCDQFVNQYADLVIDLLAASLEPREICTELRLCSRAPSTILKSDIKNITSSEQSSMSNTKSQQINTFIIYICLAATFCILAIILTAFKIRSGFLKQNPPYIRVTK